MKVSGAWGAAKSRHLSPCVGREIACKKVVLSLDTVVPPFPFVSVHGSESAHDKDNEFDEARTLDVKDTFNLVFDPCRARTHRW
jgi:hypothetical protein